MSSPFAETISQSTSKRYGIHYVSEDTTVVYPLRRGRGFGVSPLAGFLTDTAAELPADFDREHESPKVPLSVAAAPQPLVLINPHDARTAFFDNDQAQLNHRIFTNPRLINHEITKFVQDGHAPPEQEGLLRRQIFAHKFPSSTKAQRDAYFAAPDNASQHRVLEEIYTEAMQECRADVSPLREAVHKIARAMRPGRGLDKILARETPEVELVDTIMRGYPDELKAAPRFRKTVFPQHSFAAKAAQALETIGVQIFPSIMPDYFDGKELKQGYAVPSMGLINVRIGKHMYDDQGMKITIEEGGTPLHHVLLEEIVQYLDYCTSFTDSHPQWNQAMHEYLDNSLTQTLINLAHPYKAELGNSDGYHPADWGSEGLANIAVMQLNFQAYTDEVIETLQHNIAHHPSGDPSVTKACEDTIALIQQIRQSEKPFETYMEVFFPKLAEPYREFQQNIEALASQAEQYQGAKRA